MLCCSIISRLVLNLRKTYFDNAGLPSTALEEETEVVSAGITFLPRSQSKNTAQGVGSYPPVPKEHLTRRERLLDVISTHSFMGYEELGAQQTVIPSQSEDIDEQGPVQVANTAQRPPQRAEQELERRERCVEPDSLARSTDWSGVELQEMHVKGLHKETGT